MVVGSRVHCAVAASLLGLRGHGVDEVALHLHEVERDFRGAL